MSALVLRFRNATIRARLTFVCVAMGFVTGLVGGLGI